MSKGNMFLGYARGKVGSVVFYRANGQQVTRARAEVISNPKSISQREQRAIFSSVAKMAAVLRPIIDHSWQNINGQTESMRHFRRLALSALRESYQAGELVNLSSRNHMSFVPNNVPVSSGILPSIFNHVRIIGNAPVGIVGGYGNIVTSATGTLSFADLRERIPGLQPGDQLTLLRINLVSGSYQSDVYASSFTYDRVVLSPIVNDADPVLSAAGFNESYVDMVRTTNLAMLKTISGNFDGGLRQIIGVDGMSDGDALGTVAFAVIHSRATDTGWIYSSQNLVLYGGYTNNTLVLDSYAQAISQTVSQDYLDQAVSDGAAEGISGPYMQIDYEDEYTVIRPGGTSALPDVLYNNYSVISVVAYGTTENPIVSLNLAGDIADGNYQQIGIKKGNTASLEFRLTDDGNFVGTYQIWATFRDAQRALLNFNVVAEEPEP